MAPSPTGPLHIGTARTALFNWLFARKHGGVFVLRIEDTDRERSEKKYEAEMIEGLAWLGLDWDEGPLPDGGRIVADEAGAYGPYRQSRRTEIYKKYLEELLAKGEAYYCYCTKEELEAQREAMASQGLPPKYNGHCRNLKAPPPGRQPQVIRFKVPEAAVAFKDLVRGKIVFDAALLGDQIIAKDLQTPLYNFAVTVDDELMKITHVIRGEDHLSNTPKQILMQRALGFSEPIYAHIPLILNSDRSKMSKRFADTALSQYRSRGYLPQAMLNFLALLGWHPKGDREVMSAHELIDAFELERVQSSGAVFTEDKLNWLNREHMKKLTDKVMVEALEPILQDEGIQASPAFLERLVAVERNRANTLRDIVDNGRFFFTLGDYDASLLVGRDMAATDALLALKDAEVVLQKLAPESFSARETLQGAVAYIVGERKRGVVFWPLRVALSGLKASPDPLDIMTVLGKEASLKRISQAIKKLS